MEASLWILSYLDWNATLKRVLIYHTFILCSYFACICWEMKEFVHIYINTMHDSPYQQGNNWYKVWLPSSNSSLLWSQHDSSSLLSSLTTFTLSSPGSKFVQLVHSHLNHVQLLSLHLWYIAWLCICFFSCMHCPYMVYCAPQSILNFFRFPVIMKPWHPLSTEVIEAGCASLGWPISGLSNWYTNVNVVQCMLESSDVIWSLTSCVWIHDKVCVHLCPRLVSWMRDFSIM